MYAYRGSSYLTYGACHILRQTTYYNRNKSPRKARFFNIAAFGFGFGAIFRLCVYLIRCCFRSPMLDVLTYVPWHSASGVLQCSQSELPGVCWKRKVAVFQCWPPNKSSTKESVRRFLKAPYNDREPLQYFLCIGVMKKYLSVGRWLRNEFPSFFCIRQAPIDNWVEGKELL